MIFADSRAATIAILLGGAIILLTFNKKAFWTSLTVMVSVIFILFLIPTIQSFLMILIRPQNTSMREPLWNSGIEMFLNHPISWSRSRTISITFLFLLILCCSTPIY